MKKSFPTMFIELIDHFSYFSKIQALEESGKLTLSCNLDNINVSLSALKLQHDAELNAFIGSLQEKEELKRSLLVIFLHLSKDMQKMMEETLMMEMDALKKAQKSEFHAFIQNLYHEKINESTMKKKEAKKSLSESALCLSKLPVFRISKSSSSLYEKQELSETFSIYFGSRIKVMVHVCLLVHDPMIWFLNHDMEELRGQRAQILSNLYSFHLNGMVFLSDPLELFTHQGHQRDSWHRHFAKHANYSTELHFDSLKQQLESNLKNRPIQDWQTGDIVITRHSNLNFFHVMFHLICKQEDLMTEITSTCALAMGYRNLLKLAFTFGITQLTVPLYLFPHSHLEVFTLPQLGRRADMVMKLTKGVLTEMSNLLDKKSRMIQFLIPTGYQHTDSYFKGSHGYESSLFDSGKEKIAEIFRTR